MRYFVHGNEVSRQEAARAWWRSKTYRDATRKTRDGIFTDAEKGIDDNGELNHLREAGITIKQEPSHDRPIR